MEEEKEKRPWWKKILIGVEILVGLFLILTLCIVANSALVFLTLYLCFGECNADQLSIYDNYIRLSYSAFLVVGISVYLKYINNKYHIL
jgi:uncharacterized BrkB/YihY/UPF0761 family membrane protein